MDTGGQQEPVAHPRVADAIIVAVTAECYAVLRAKRGMLVPAPGCQSLSAKQQGHPDVLPPKRPFPSSTPCLSTSHQTLGKTPLSNAQGATTLKTENSFRVQGSKKNMPNTPIHLKCKFH